MTKQAFKDKYLGNQVALTVGVSENSRLKKFSETERINIIENICSELELTTAKIFTSSVFGKVLAIGQKGFYFHSLPQIYRFKEFFEDFDQYTKENLDFSKEIKLKMISPKEEKCEKTRKFLVTSMKSLDGATQYNEDIIDCNINIHSDNISYKEYLEIKGKLKESSKQSVVILNIVKFELEK